MSGMCQENLDRENCLLPISCLGLHPGSVASFTHVYVLLNVNWVTAA